MVGDLMWWNGSFKCPIKELRGCDNINAVYEVEMEENPVVFDVMCEESQVSQANNVTSWLEEK